MGKRKPRNAQSMKLRIGDQWNAITIIALSQTNPLKAIAEFVENSIAGVDEDGAVACCLGARVETEHALDHVVQLGERFHTAESAADTDEGEKASLTFRVGFYVGFFESTYDVVA